jgi:hypothetical protein
MGLLQKLLHPFQKIIEVFGILGAIGVAFLTIVGFASTLLKTLDAFAELGLRKWPDSKILHKIDDALDGVGGWLAILAKLLRKASMPVDRPEL